jgi:putative hydrolase of the HAD superfamily
MSAHKTIIFDLGKVLVDFDFGRAYRALEQVCGCRMPEMRRRAMESGLYEKFETGRIDPRLFVTSMCDLLEAEIRYEDFCGIFNSIFAGTLVPESLLEGLAQRYRLLLLSNTNAIHYEMLDRAYPLLRHFHHRILSFEVNAMKPEPEIYRRAIERAGCRPEECFYTDDIPEFIAAAKTQGIDAVRFESAAQLQGELERRGIAW